MIDALFQKSGFFDPRDLVQVKYEMLRRVRLDKQPVAGTAASFGLSRPSFYEAQHGFEREGLAGLITKKRGPRGAHKFTEEVTDFLEEAAAGDPSLRALDLAQRVKERFGITVHPRSIERALARREKNGGGPGAGSLEIHEGGGLGASLRIAATASDGRTTPTGAGSWRFAR